MRCWRKARWRAAQGIDHEYFFRGYEDETRTRTQLKLNLFTLGYTLPNEYSLVREEPASGTRWNYPTLLRSTD